MRRSKVIYRYRTLNGDSYEIVKFRRAKFKMYGVRHPGARQVLGTMDSELKARKYLEELQKSSDGQLSNQTA